MKNKNAYLIANLIIIFMALAVFLGIQTNEYAYFKELAFKQAQNDAEMAAVDINAQITNFSLSQRVAGEMMANDLFLKEWCMEETNDVDSVHHQVLYRYLKNYKEKYDYDVVFFVSDKTWNYYYDGGLNRTVSPASDYDVWYFNFLNLKSDYDIQVDRDEVNDYNVTIFVNCLVKDSEGKTLGVVGSGREIKGFQDFIDDLTGRLGVDICVVNSGNALSSFFDSNGAFMNVADAVKKMGVIKDDIVGEVPEEGKRFTKGSNCYCVKKNDEMKWNIVVKKDTTETIQGFLKKSAQRIAFMIIILIIYVIISFTFLIKLQRMTAISLNTDDVTGLQNNKIFKEDFERYSKSWFKKSKASFFVLDIDNFKSFNDTYGHLYGNTVLHMVADELKNGIGTEGRVARWGGDEFAGVIFRDSGEALKIMNGIQESIRARETKQTVSFSCGIADIQPHDTIKNCFDNADTAVYKAKENGKAQCAVYKKE